MDEIIITEKESKAGNNKHCESCAENRQGSYQKQKKKLMDGLRRAEGQVRGIQRMVEEERYCVDVLDQISAVRMALAKLSMTILDEHVRGCVSDAIAGDDSAGETIEELMGIIKKITT